MVSQIEILTPKKGPEAVFVEQHLGITSAR